VSAAELTAVVDLDGVVADVRHRLHHVTGRSGGGGKDWQAFFAAAGDDPLLDEGARTVRTLAEGYRIVYLSGRPERLRAVTEEWLHRHDLPAGPVLLRPDRDFRPARRYKLDALARLAETATVALLVDDDPRVLEEARQAGYDVLPATWMGEQPELHRAQERDGRT
jgi:phosphoglycolate phosphatase-like HAD superfamily hydrolase